MGIGGLIVLAFALRLWLPTKPSFDLHIHDVYHVITLADICFWLLISAACVWSMVVLPKLLRPA